MQKTNSVDLLNKRRRTEFITENFLSLPRRCQEMFFDFLETFTDGNHDAYLPFMVSGFCSEFCKSPIEMIFSMAFSTLSDGKVFEYNFVLMEQEFIQTNGEKYVVDFLFDTEENKDFYKFQNNLKLIIECDGHDYHKLTKKQVEYDNKRDHDLKFVGYDILHFSGSQLYKEPWKCAETVYNYILSEVGSVNKHLPCEVGVEDA